MAACTAGSGAYCTVLAPIVYMAHGLSTLFGEEFHKWIALFVDGILGYGYTKQHASDRQRIVSMALEKLDIKDAFEHVVVAEKDREKLTVAPPIRLDAKSFTVEELRSWGYSEEEIEELQGADEVLLQWQHAPQGLAPIAPFWRLLCTWRTG